MSEGAEGSGERRCGGEGRCGGGKGVAASRGELRQANEQSVPVTRRRAGESGNTTGLRKRGGKRKCSGVGAECGGEGKCVRTVAVRGGGGCGGKVAVVSGDGERQRGHSGEGAAASEGAVTAVVNVQLRAGAWKRECSGCELSCCFEIAVASTGAGATLRRREEALCEGILYAWERKEA